MRAAQTAYADDGGRGRRERCARRQAGVCWHEKIRELVDAGYCFAAETYSRDGYLYRGLRGRSASLGAGEPAAAHVQGCALSDFEKQLAVWLVSSDPLDALAVARPWDTREASAMLVIPASVFRSRQVNGEAAVMLTAEPGMVFRYPFFAVPPCLAWCRRVYSGLGTDHLASPAEVVHWPRGLERRELECEVGRSLADAGLLASRVTRGRLKPE